MTRPPETVRVAAARAAARPSGPVVVGRGVSVSVGGRAVLSGVDLEIAPSTFTVVLGPNGVGKSTLLKAMLGLLPISSGDLRVLGQPAGAERRAIGYVPQSGTFDSSVRVRGLDVVRLGLDGNRLGITLPGRRSRDEWARVNEMVRLVEAEGYAWRPIGQLSGGEQQRLIIAQALARQPQLLLLDEPLDSLDLSSQGAVAALIQRICRGLGVTVVMVAHDVNPILHYLDQVIYLAAGAAVSGTPESVITSDTLSALYRTKVDVLRASDGRLVVVGQPGAWAHHIERHNQ